MHTAGGIFALRLTWGAGKVWVSLVIWKFPVLFPALQAYWSMGCLQEIHTADIHAHCIRVMIPCGCREDVVHLDWDYHFLFPANNVLKIWADSRKFPAQHSMHTACDIFALRFAKVWGRRIHRHLSLYPDPLSLSRFQWTVYMSASEKLIYFQRHFYFPHDTTPEWDRGGRWKTVWFHECLKWKYIFLWKTRFGGKMNFEE